METISNIISIIGMLTGIAGMLTGIASILLRCLGVSEKKFEVINEFFDGMEDPAFIKARAIIYNKKGEDFAEINDENMAFVVNYFHHWGIFAKKHYLPMWVFDYGSGEGVIRLYEKVESFIIQRRWEHEDNTYASGFEWLYYKLKRRKRGWGRIKQRFLNCFLIDGHHR